MCHQKLLLYRKCGHSFVIGTAKPCEDTTTCPGPTKRHPLGTVRVDLFCPTCQDKQNRDLMKRIKVDDTLSTFKEKIRRLREEVARRGFTGEGKGKGTVSHARPERDEKEDGGEMSSGSDSGSSTTVFGTGVDKEEEAHIDEDMDKPDAAALARAKPTIGNSTSNISSTDKPSSQPPTPTIALTVRDDRFVGGVRLATTSVAPVDEEYKLRCLKATAPREKEYRELGELELPLLVQERMMMLAGMEAAGSSVEGEGGEEGDEKVVENRDEEESEEEKEDEEKNGNEKEKGEEVGGEDGGKEEGVKKENVHA